MIKKTLWASSLTAALILSGCGSSSDSTTVSSASTGYFVDAPVANLNYDCVADGTSGITDANGAFTCQNMSQVRFRIGELIIGELASLPADGYVFPQDLIGVSRDDVTNPQVTAIAQALQSLDADGNPENGITLTEDAMAAMPAGAFNPNDVNVYLNAASVPPSRIRTQAQTQEHLRATVESMGTNGFGKNITPGTSVPAPVSDLPQDVKDSLAYMGNEERLAHDVYLNLYNYHLSQGVGIVQLQNIAQAETNHIDSVQTLVRRYNLSADDLTNVTSPVADSSITQDQMPSGQYGIPAIQSLYDTLYAKGTASAQDALEVGCMVEVTDINDLNEKIATAQAAGIDDIVSVFDTLRNGSYTHYWTFDAGLKTMGIADGCCSLGNAYCHPEYPQDDQGYQGGRH